MRWLHPCDVGSDEQIEKFFAAARDKFGTIDFLVHSLAFADRNYLAKRKISLNAARRVRSRRWTSAPTA
jgi:enoyl-[acyl-carrier-protein] reductase (NADH)